VIGRSLRFEEISPEAMRSQLLTRLPPAVVDGALTYWARLVTEPEVVSPTVEEITGAPARPFRAWVSDHASDFLRTRRILCGGRRRSTPMGSCGGPTARAPGLRFTSGTSRPWRSAC
jgi:hypothetical protein